MQLKFDMPFNWNLTRLKNANIFVHEELYVPKPNAFTSEGGYAGNVNGIHITKSVMVDNSNPAADVIHVMLLKNDLLALADQVNKTGQAPSGIMKFTLQPAEGSAIGSMGSMASMSSPNSSMGRMS